MRSIQHKKEAYWFYRFVSPLYDRWVNPLFWTRACAARRSSWPASTNRACGHLTWAPAPGSPPRASSSRWTPDAVTMLDQSPDQLRRARRKPELAGCAKLLGDAERLPFEDDSFDRYVSCGSIEYWPDPARAIAEAHRVVRPGGTALVVGPLPPGQRLARLLADAWMLFPTEAEYRGWFEAAGFEDIEVRLFGRPGTATRTGPGTGWRSRAAPPSRVRRPRRALHRSKCDEPWTARRVLRFGAGALAGLAFVPVGILLNARARRAGRALPAGGGPLTVDATSAGAGRSTAATAPFAALTTLWLFSRPHTLSPPA